MQFGREYVYGDANRLRQTKQGGAVLKSYLYNHRGERVQREPAGGSTQLIDSLGLETCLLTTVATGNIRDHAALYSSQGDGNGGPVIYDPAGGYGAVNGGGASGLVTGEAASMERFIQFHAPQKVEKNCKATTNTEEESIVDKAMSLPSAGPFQCAIMASSALQGHQSFPHVEAGTFWPGNLRKQVRKKK